MNQHEHTTYRHNPHQRRGFAERHPLVSGEGEVKMAALLVCDYPVVADGIGRMLEEEKHEVVGVCQNLDQVEKVNPESRIDVVIIEPRMPNGLDLVDWLQDHRPQVKVVLLSNPISDELLIEAERLKVAAVLPKTIKTAELLRVVEDVAAGRKVESKFDIHEVLKRYEARGFAKIERLNDVDREILKCLNEGLSDREIANTVYLSPQTIRNRVSRLLRVLGRENRTQLALMIQQYDDLRGGFKRKNLST
jgi:DNA-binding NarL/FixJ family response regulator